MRSTSALPAIIAALAVSVLDDDALPAAAADITTVAGGFIGEGGQATGASLSTPWGVAVDASGNLFIADSDNHRVRRVDAATAIMTTVAGNGSMVFSGDGGPATGAGLFGPIGLAIDTNGNLLIVDSGNNRIRRAEGIAAVVSTPTPTPTPIPSLTQSGLIALAGLMAAVLLLRTRRTGTRGRRV